MTEVRQIHSAAFRPGFAGDVQTRDTACQDGAGNSNVKSLCRESEKEADTTMCLPYRRAL
jgi:hypothetical protein